MTANLPSKAFDLDPQMILDMASGLEEPDAIAARYGLDDEAWARLKTWQPFLNAWTSGEVSASAGGLIRWPARLLIPIGFFLLSLQGISELIKRIAALTDSYRLEHGYETPLQ